LAIRTDLALEAAEAPKAPRGVRRETVRAGRLTVDRVHVGAAAAAALGKAKGDYVTVTAPSFSGPEELTEEELCALAREISSMLPPKGLVLVAGLGNNDVTPDAVGPRTARRVLATRHISGDTARLNGLPNLRPVAVIAPGVLGQTGVESAEIIRALTKALRPAAVAVVDALAARSVSRLGNTVQISAAISPGSGVMNSRQEFSRKSLGAPVVALGVPTVVDASTLAGDLLKDPALQRERLSLFGAEGAAMIITPREIDTLLRRACKALSLALNKALQPDMTLEELEYLAL
jgi:spore protease